jgi:hypothetical protein
MSSLETPELARRAEALYEQRWKAQLEQTHHGSFVAIDPVAEEYFLGSTLAEAFDAAKQAHPDRRFYGIRIGHAAVFEIGIAL